MTNNPYFQAAIVGSITGVIGLYVNNKLFK